MNFTIKLWSLYKPNALYRPVRTKIATAFSLFFGADIFCQFAIEKNKNWNKKRTLTAAIVAGGIVNPLNQTYLIWL